MRYTDRLADAGIAPSVGSQAVEFATLVWVDWFNTRRLLGPVGDIPPAEYEAQYCPVQGGLIQRIQSPTVPVRFSR